MARPTTVTLRLADLDPRAVAGEVVSQVRNHIAHLSLCLSPGIEWRESGGDGGDGSLASARPAETNLGWTVEQLTRFAQVGELGDWREPATAADAILDVLSALYTSAGDPNIGGGDLDVADADPDSAIGLVLVASHARVRLARRGGAGLSARELGALAGLSATQVRLLARQGELTLEDGVCPRAEARRWLSGRGVAGLEKAR